MTVRPILACLAAALLAGCGGGDERAAAGAVRLMAVGDAANGSDDAAEVARMIEAAKPARVLYLGDVYPWGSEADFREHYDPAYGSVASRTWPTPGNHEWPARDDGYLPYWRAEQGAVAPWYARRAGGWEILSLNSEAPHGEDSPQLRWLRARLARRRTTCRLAFWHRPRFSAGDHGDQADVAPLWDALRGHARLVVSGHDHDMQRFEPVDGLVQVVSGAGGAERYDVAADDEHLAFADDDHFGALRIDLRPGSATLAFVDAGGAVLDRSSIACQPG